MVMPSLFTCFPALIYKPKFYVKMFTYSKRCIHCLIKQTQRFAHLKSPFFLCQIKDFNNVDAYIPLI